MTRVFVLTNHKGGVGKSTTATTLAYGITTMLRGAGASNPRVLLIDTDSQGHATLVSTGRSDFGVNNSLYTVLMAERADAMDVLKECVIPSHWDENLHVLPAAPLLEGVERELNGAPGAPFRLAKPLNKIAGQYAAVVIDTRPSFSLMTEMGLLAATDAIIPVEPRYLETVGLMSVISKINQVREGWGHPSLRVSGILVTKMDTRVRGHNQQIAELTAHPLLGKLLCGVIPSNEAISYAHNAHQNIFTYDPKAAASAAYAQFVGTMLRRTLKGGA